jgi:putative SOS response-associated peptidase YedK
MMKKGRTSRKLYSELEGKVLMEKVPDEKKMKENSKNDKTMKEIDNIYDIHNRDEILMEDNDKEIWLQEGGLH